MRVLSTSASLQSGHSRWSTIKHDKAKNDSLKNKQRSVFAHEIANASKCPLSTEAAAWYLADSRPVFGPDPNSNPRLVTAIAQAKRGGFSKASIEAAIARGQGVSASGAKLEPVTVEAILPPQVAVVIDCQTDNKLRTLQEIRSLVKHYEGNVTPTSYLFEKKGRIIFRKREGVGADEVLEAALEAGALDVVEDAEGRVVVYTETNDTKATAETLASSLGLEVEESEIIWDPNHETKIGLEDAQAAETLSTFVERLQEDSAVQGVYMNVARGSLDDAVWAELQSRVTA